MLLVKATDPLRFPHKDCGRCAYTPSLKPLTDAEVRTAVAGLVAQAIPDMDRLLYLLVSTAKARDVLETKTMTTFLVSDVVLPVPGMH